MFYYFWKGLKYRRMSRKLLLAAILFGVFGMTESMAQITCVGAAGHYGTAIKEFGIGAKGLYTINEKIDIAPGLVYFFPHKENPEEAGHLPCIYNPSLRENIYQIS